MKGGVAEWKMPTLEVGEEFDSYEDLQEALRIYSEATHAVFTRRNSRTVEAANRQLGEGEQRYPKFFKYVYLKYGCKHFGEPRRSSRGIRPNQRSFKTGCPAFITVSANRGRSKLVVVKSQLHHSHDTSSERYNKYPEVRRIGDDLEEAAGLLMDFKVPASSVARQLRASSGRIVSPQDVYNLRVKRIKQNLHTTSSLMDCLAKILLWGGEGRLAHGHKALLQDLASARQDGGGKEGAMTALIEAMTRPNVAGEVIAQAEKGMERSYDITPMDKSNYKLRAGKEEVFSVHLAPKDIRCTCQFYVRKTLPCSHIFAVYLEFANAQLSENYELNSRPENISASMGVNENVKVETDREEGEMTPSQRYRDVHRLVMDMPEMCANLTHKEFCERYELLRILCQAWRDSKPVRIVVGENFVDTCDHTYIQQPQQVIIEAGNGDSPFVEQTMIEVDNSVVTHVIF